VSGLQLGEIYIKADKKGTYSTWNVDNCRIKNIFDTALFLKLPASFSWLFHQYFYVCTHPSYTVLCHHVRNLHKWGSLITQRNKWNSCQMLKEIESKELSFFFIDSIMDKEGATDVIYLDLCKAFDTVPPTTAFSLNWRDRDLMGGLFGGCGTGWKVTARG